MALLSSMLRRPSLFSLAVRTVASTTRVISTVPSLGADISRRCSVPSQLFSTATATVMKPTADHSLVGILESEIKIAEEDIENHQVEIADGFPFEIVDNPGEQTILLKREFDGEIIKVAVDIPNIAVEGDDEEDRKEEENEDTGIPMVVSVSKGNGQELEFGLTAFADEICIDSVSVRQPEQSSEGSKPYEGPDFDDLDESLQDALRKYLEHRGIQSNTTKFLQEYMENKDFREYVMWLKDIKHFVEQ